MIYLIKKRLIIKHYSHRVELISIHPQSISKVLQHFFCFQSYISTTHHLFNSILSVNSRDEVLNIYVQNERTSSVTYPEIWRSPYGDPASPAGDAAFS
jgi:hypothetical protein